jgi:hypothetical protein
MSKLTTTMPELVSTLENFRNLLMECNDMSLGLITHPGELKIYKERLMEMRSSCDKLVQQVILQGLFSPPMTGLDLLRKQYLDLSKELYHIRISGAPAWQIEATGNILNNVLAKIKKLENVNPSGLMLD